MKEGAIVPRFWKHAYHFFVFGCSPSIVSFFDANVRHYWSMIPGPHMEASLVVLERPLERLNHFERST